LNKYLKHAGKFLLYLLGFLILLVIAVLIAIQTPAFQQFAKDKITAYVSKKIGTPLTIDRLDITFPKEVVLTGVYLEDRSRDTLLYGDTLSVDISMFRLLQNTVELNRVDLRGITAKVRRSLPDSAFNFDYIIQAFASKEQPSQPADTSGGMNISLRRINLDRIRVIYDDAVTGNDVSAFLGHFDTRFKTFDLEKMEFSAPEITLAGLQVRARQTKEIAQSTQEADTIDAAPAHYPDIQFDKLSLADIQADYSNTVNGTAAKAALRQLFVRSNSINLKEQEIDLAQIGLLGIEAVVSLDNTGQKVVQSTSEEVEHEMESKGWKAKVTSITIDDVQFKMDDLTQKKAAQSIDVNHLAIDQLKGTVKNLSYDPQRISASLDQVGFREQSGINLKNFTADVLYGSREAYLRNLTLAFNNTVIRDEISLKYPSIDALRSDPGALEINAVFNHSVVKLSDLLVFAPQLAQQDIFRKYPEGVLHIHSTVRGKIGDLTIPNLELSGIGATKLRASGKISGLPDVNKMRLELNFRELTSTAADLKNILPAGTIPSNITLPERFTLKGTIDGLTNNFRANLKLATSLGNADIRAAYDASAGKGREKYDATVKTYAFDAGRLIGKSDQIGKVSVEGRIKGSGTDLKTAKATFDLLVNNAQYNNYDYQGIRIEGNADQGIINARLNSSDVNARMHGAVSANLTGAYPAAKMDLMIDSIDLQRLRFAAEEMRFHGRINADFATADPDHLNGQLAVTQAIIVNKGKRFTLDSVGLLSMATADSNRLYVQTEFLTASIEGKYQLTQIGNALMATVDRYFDLPTENAPKKPEKDQYFYLSAHLTRSPLVEQFLPDLKEMDAVSIRGIYDSREDLLVLKTIAPLIRYQDNILRNTNLDIDTESDSLQYRLSLGQVSAGSVLIDDATVTGFAGDDKITFDLTANEGTSSHNVRLAGYLQALAGTFRVSLNNDGLVLNGQPWEVTDDNALFFGQSGIKAANFVLSNNGQSIGINSQGYYNSPMDVRFSQFNIETITGMISKDTILAGGLIDGEAVISDLNTSPVFNADMVVSDFHFKGDTLGDIKLLVNNKDLNTIAADIVVNGRGSEFSVKGNYYTNSENPLDLILDIKNIDLKAVESYAMGMVRDLTGDLKGRLSIRGSASAPKLQGALRFEQAQLNYTAFNSLYRLDNEEIRFEHDGIHLDNFTIRDQSGSRIVLDGLAATEDLRNYTLGLRMQAQNFQVLNSTRQNNDLYFGKLFIDANVNIKGTSSSPVVDGSLRVNEPTDLTIVIPQQDPRLIDREGVIEFVDMDAPALDSILLVDSVLTAQTGLAGLDVAMNIIIDKESVFNIIIDEGNGDFLRIRGEAELTGGIDPSGKVTLAGIYEIEEGKYNITFNFLKRQFLIQKGSKITWTGGPTEANVDVTAIYIANAPPLDLISNQLSTSSQTVRNTYKQRLPFEVNLNMKGQLLQPLITFDIQLPNKNYGVSNDVISTVNTRLAQLRQEPAELNKQVFAVLLLNHFVGDNPFAAESGGFDGERFARQSVSKILTEQLNNLAADMIAGVDLNFDINSTEDYSSGELQNRTDLTVGLSKRLFNERLKVSVGSNFELEGGQNTQQKTTNIAGDISAEYQLTKDGRYLIRAYRKDEYIVVLGQVVETGVGFILTVDFDDVSDIFAKKSEELKIKEKEARKAQEEREQKQLEIQNQTVQ